MHSTPRFSIAIIGRLVGFVLRVLKGLRRRYYLTLFVCHCYEGVLWAFKNFYQEFLEWFCVCTKSVLEWFCVCTKSVLEQFRHVPTVLLEKACAGVDISQIELLEFSNCLSEINLKYTHGILLG